MRALTHLSAFVLLALPGCSLFPGWDDSPGPTLNEEYLTQHWAHSREEEPQDSRIEIFRPAGYKEFPPSWFRMRYIFEEGGSCQWLFLAPNDGHYFKTGTWRIASDNVLVIEQDADTVRYRVMRLMEDLLEMRRL